MAEREATAVWEGGVPQGKGSITLGSRACESPYSFASRFETAPGTNPEESLGAAHAGCFSMALALGLTQAGHPPTRITTTAHVGIVKNGDGDLPERQAARLTAPGSIRARSLALRNNLADSAPRPDDLGLGAPGFDQGG